MRPPILIVLALAVLGVSLPARAADRPVTREGLVDLLKGERVWCSGWHEADQSCEDVSFVDLAEGGKVLQTSRLRMSADPDLQMVVRETVEIEGGALCSTFRFEALDIVILMDERPASAELALPLLGVLAESMAGLEGKKACESYVRNEATGELRSTVTLDGVEAPEFNSTYRLIAPETRIQLRPMLDDAESSQTTT
ncbi:MAG: hypothetical protein ACOY4K_05555 [Pseudomonadota bacterium]